MFNSQLDVIERTAQSWGRCKPTGCEHKDVEKHCTQQNDGPDDTSKAQTGAVKTEFCLCVSTKGNQTVTTFKKVLYWRVHDGRECLAEFFLAAPPPRARSTHKIF